MGSENLKGNLDGYDLFGENNYFSFWPGPGY